ncbi:PilW family protein [Noviherbaspirillum pedocola]|uniref:PilW family protein n=1 Tax=Noviherbaspirillum pedocola TaxID=2801341 RepID=A0A934ST83_9BURK|nr:PilW family protein [Noviherbaspirillum pedocola]MBK4735020.1 PilW family protein [Noviherbaspirillum pedocola]
MPAITPFRRQQGASLIEIMIAITIGLLILAGVSSLFVRNSRAHDEIRRANEQIENGRYAASLLADDLRNAGYLAEFDPSSMATPVSPDPCATDVASLAAAMAMPVQGINDVATAPTCLSDVKTGTDIVVVRRASTCAVGETGCEAAVSGAVYLQASGCNSATELGSGNVNTYYALSSSATSLTKKRVDCVTTAPLHRYRVHIYFVANNNVSGDGVPTLKRAELGPSGFSIVPLVDGIENLQFEYGIDSLTAATGMPASWAADAGSDAAWRNVVAVKIHVLARAATASAGYTDAKTYTLGAGVSYTPTGAAANYKRHVYETTARVNNTAQRNM